MRKRLRYSILTIVTITALSSSCSEAQDIKWFVFAHANVIPMNKETVLSDYSVIIRDGTIRELGPSSSLKIPQGATVVDVTGKFMIPALSDMHVHLEGDAWNIMYPRESRFSSEEIDFNDILFMYIA